MPVERGERWPHTRLLITALLAGVSLSAIAAHAQDATWLQNPSSGDFNTASNWNPPTVPTGTAFFGNSHTTSLTFSANTTAGGWTFNAGASNYTFTNAVNLTFNGAGIVINGGSANIINNDSLDFFNGSTAGSATITNNGGMLIFGSTAGSATITNNSMLQFSFTATAGSATIINNFDLTFLNSSTAGSATIINNNSLRFFNGTTAGSAAIINNNTLEFFSSTAGSATVTNNSMLQFFDTSTGDTARLINGAAGTIDISTLTTTGMTAGSIEGDGAIKLGAKNLLVGGNNLSTTFAGVLQDGGSFGGAGGSLTKTGTGTLTLSGTNTYTGTTDVSGGTLIVNGSIASSSLTRVNNGGSLGGIGTVGNTQINSGGIFAPGSGTVGSSMTVVGNLALQSSALYVVYLNPTTSSFANVTGTASLSGTVQAVFAPGSYMVRSYDILHATGGLGGTTFFNLTGDVPANFTANLSYSATDVFLNLTASLAGPASLGGPSVFVGLNENQQSVANAINAFFNNGGTLPPSFLSLFGLTGANLANALTSLSGEVATGAQEGAFQLMTEFMGLMLDPFVAGRAGVGGMYGGASAFAPEREELPEDIALAYAKVLRTPVYKATPFEQRWSVWGGVYGGYNKTSGDPLVVGSHDLTARTAGAAAGMDYRIAPGTVVGFALAGAGTGWSLAQNLGSGGSDAFQAGVYATTRSGPFYLAGALAFTQHWMSLDRYAFAGDHLYASFNAESIGGRAEAGYRIPNAVAAITPYAAVQAQNFHTPAYSETDYSGGSFGLTYNAQNASDTRSELGARFDRLILLNWNAVLALRGRVAWAHDWISDPNLLPSFEALPGASFLVQGATPAKNAALTSAGAELRLVNGVSFLGKFDGEFATHSQTYAGTGTVRYVW